MRERVNSLLQILCSSFLQNRVLLDLKERASHVIHVLSILTNRTPNVYHVQLEKQQILRGQQTVPKLATLENSSRMEVNVWNVTTVVTSLFPDTLKKNVFIALKVLLLW